MKRNFHTVSSGFYLVAALLTSTAAAPTNAQSCSPGPITQLGGGTVAVARVGGAGSTTAVAGVGTRFEVLNVSTNPPTLAGSVDLGKRIVNIDTTGNYSYVLLTDQLVVIDHSVPSAPLPLTQAPVPPDDTQNGHPNNLAQSIDVSGTRAVAARGEFLHVYDTSVPQAPTLTATYFPGLYGDINDAITNGTFAYVASYNTTADFGFIAILDISNAATPVFRGAVNLSGVHNRPTALALSGTTLYAAVWSTVRSLVLRYDVSNPAAPVLLPGSVEFTGSIDRLTIDGSAVYAARNSAGTAVINYAAPAAPVVATSISTNGSTLDVAVNTSTRRLFIADTEGGFRVFNVTNQFAPASAGARVIGPANARDMVMNDAGTLAFIADGAAGLRVMSTALPASPSLLARLPLPGQASRIALAGNLVLVGGSTGFQIVDVSNPSAPALRSATPLPSYVGGVALQGSFAYCTSGTDELRIYDVSNPASPVLRGTGNLISSGATIGMTISGRRLVVIQHNVIELWDVGNPASPAMQSSMPRYSSEVVISGNTLYSAGTSGLAMYDITNFAAPVQLNGSTFDRGIVSLALSGPRATAIAFDGRLQYYSIANQTAQLLHTSEPLGIDAQRIHLRGVTLHLADGVGGYRSLERFTWHPPAFDRSFEIPRPDEPTIVGPPCTFTFSAPPVIADPPVTNYEWKLGGDLLVDGTSALGTISGATTSTVTITGLRRNALDRDTAYLYCYATNSCGTSRFAIVAHLRPCAAEFNCDQTVNPDDLGDFINCYFSTSPPCAAADFNADGNIDPDDLGDYINTYFSGRCE